MKLYEIASQIESLLDEITEHDGEITEENEKRLSRLLSGRQEKIINMGLMIKNWNAEAEAIREEERKLSSRRKALENKSERLKSYLRYHFRDDDRIDDPRIVIQYRNSDAVKVEVPVNLLPQAYVKIIHTAKPDLMAIGAVLRSGGNIPGCALERTLIIK